MRDTARTSSDDTSVDGFGAQLRFGVGRGLAIVLPCCIGAILVYAVRGMAPFQPWTSLSALLGAFLSSGVVGGVLYGLLARWRSSIVGRFGLGAVITLGASFCVALFHNGFTDSDSNDWASVGAFMVLGGVIGLFGFRPKRRGR